MIAGGSLHPVAGDLEVPAGNLIGLAGKLSGLRRDIDPRYAAHLNSKP